MPEPTYILRPHHPICITDGDDGFADPNHSFTDVHVVAGNMEFSELRRFLGQNVEVSLYDQMGAQIGHHHAPLVAWIIEISPEVEQIVSTPSQALPADYSKAVAAATAAEPAPIDAMSIHPLDDDLRAFYRSFGFEDLPLAWARRSCALPLSGIIG